MNTCKSTKSDNADFQTLVKELDADLILKTLQIVFALRKI